MTNIYYITIWIMIGSKKLYKYTFSKKKKYNILIKK